MEKHEPFKKFNKIRNSQQEYIYTSTRPFLISLQRTMGIVTKLIVPFVLSVLLVLNVNHYTYLINICIDFHHKTSNVHGRSISCMIRNLRFKHNTNEVKLSNIQNFFYNLAEVEKMSRMKPTCIWSPQKFNIVLYKITF